MKQATQQIVRQDIGIALVTLTIGVMFAGTFAFAAAQWWIGVVATPVFGILVAASDRSHAGKWALITIGGLISVAIGLGALLSVIDEGLLPILFLGLGLGTLLNRILIGVVHDIPDVRLQRGQST